MKRSVCAGCNSKEWIIRTLWRKKRNAMLQPLLLLTTLVAVLMGVGCASTPRYNPFKIPQDEFYSKIKTIALAQIRVPRDLEDPTPVRSRFESLIDAKLREAGFSTVPSRELEAIFDKVAQQKGGLFDPVTGKPDEARVKSVWENTLLLMRERFNADSVLLPRIEVVDAEFYEGEANWDGANEWFTSRERNGSIRALSLVVVIKDASGLDVYIGRGGIQVASKISGGKFVLLPRAELFANQERNVAAVNVALNPLVRKPAPTGASGKKY